MRTREQRERAVNVLLASLLIIAFAAVGGGFEGLHGALAGAGIAAGCLVFTLVVCAFLEFLLDWTYKGE